MNNENIEISVVVPVYNSEKTLEELYSRLEQTLTAMNRTFEIIFVNDKSKDGSYSVLREIYKNNNNNVVVIDLVRNFGQHNALMCGFNYCRGNYVVTIDDDLQNPPEDIEKLYNKILEGYDAVFGVPLKKEHQLYKNFGSYLMRKLNHKIFNIKNGLVFSSFRIIRREIINEIKNFKTPFPYVTGMILSITRSVVNEDVRHLPRKAGQSNYNISRLVKLAFNLLINYSTIPLRYVGALGLIVSLISLCLGLVYIFNKLFTGKVPEGWTTIVVLISFYNSVILVIFFFLGEYISRMLKETTKVRQYSVRYILSSNKMENEYENSVQ